MSETDFPAIPELGKLSSLETTEQNKGPQGLPVLHERSELYHLFKSYLLEFNLSKEKWKHWPQSNRPCSNQSQQILNATTFINGSRIKQCLKARNWLKQARPLHTCLEQFSASSLLLKMFDMFSVKLFNLALIPLKSFLQDKLTTEWLLKWLTKGVEA